MADIDPLALFSALVGIFGGLMLLIGALTLLKSEPKQYQMPANELSSGANVNAFYDKNQKAFPPHQTQPAQSYVPPATNSWKAPDTGSFAPRSVTEGTTKLLQREKDE
jgi:hypothetical protein